MKVRYVSSTIEQVNWGSNDNPESVLVRGKYYDLLREEVHSWHTKYVLKDFPDLKFNSVSFRPSRIYEGYRAYDANQKFSLPQKEK